MASKSLPGPRAQAEAFPKTVYVHRGEKNDPTLFVDPNADDVADGELVGEYELKTTWKKKVRHELEPRS